MRVLSPELQTYLATRIGVRVRVLIWLAARNRTTDEVTYFGFWTGDDHQEFVIDGVSRLYYGAGNVLQVGDLTLEAALNIRQLTNSLTGLTPEGQAAIREYDLKGGETEQHLAFFSLETNNLIDNPVRVFKGWTNKLKIATPAIGGQGSVSIDSVGHTRLLTKKLAVKRSHENQRLRNPADTFFKDVGMTGQTIQTPWGSKNV